MYKVCHVKYAYCVTLYIRCFPHPHSPTPHPPTPTPEQIIVVHLPSY
jgi:hypothetical protein